MKFTKRNIIYILSAFLIFLSINKMIFSHNEKTDPYETVLKQITRSFAQKMNAEFGLQYIGDGIHLNENLKKIEEVEINFTASRRASIEEARALQVLVINKLISTINEDKRISLLIKEDPLTYQKVVVSISFRGPYGICFDENVTYVTNVPDAAVEKNRNRIFYYGTDPTTGDSVDLFNELYLEALNQAQAHPVRNLHVHETSRLEEAIDEALGSFIHLMDDQYNIRCWSIGGKITTHLQHLGAKLTVFHSASLEQAREVELFATQMLLEAINNSKHLRPYLTHYPFSSDQLNIRICFRDDWNLTYKDGSMESVVIKNDEITYFQQASTMNEGKVEHLPFHPPICIKESYEDAIRNMQNIPHAQRHYLKISQN